MSLCLPLYTMRFEGIADESILQLSCIQPTLNASETNSMAG